jgi:hypothetical protein
LEIYTETMSIFQKESVLFNVETKRSLKKLLVQLWMKPLAKRWVSKLLILLELVTTTRLELSSF